MKFKNIITSFLQYGLAIYVFIIMAFIISFKLTEAVLEPFYCQRLLVYVTGIWIVMMFLLIIIHYKIIYPYSRSSPIKGLVILALILNFVTYIISSGDFGSECGKAWLECNQGNCKKSSEF